MDAVLGTMAEPAAGVQQLRRGPVWRPAGAELSPEKHAARVALRRTAARLFAEYGAAAISRRKVAEMAGQDRGFAAACYPDDSDLLSAVVGEHVLALNAAVTAAFVALEHAGAVGRLEGTIRAWLDHVAAEPAEHRCLLFCTGLLPEERRTMIQLEQRFVLERVLEALCAAVPGLGDLGEAGESVLRSARGLLSDAFGWPEPPEAAERARVARRIAGMLIAAGEAEVAGSWVGVGRASGTVGVQVVESHLARQRWRQVMDVAEAGGEVVLTRWGRPVVKVVGC